VVWLTVALDPSPDWVMVESFSSPFCRTLAKPKVLLWTMVEVLKSPCWLLSCRFPLRFDPGFSSRSDPGCW